LRGIDGQLAVLGAFHAPAVVFGHFEVFYEAAFGADCKIVVSSAMAGLRCTRGPNRMLRFRSRAALTFCLLLVFGNAPAHDQNQPNKETDKAKPVFLIARPAIGDPIFQQSVVLLFPTSVEASEGGGRVVIGLIVNRAATVSLGEVFPDEKAFKNRTETAYFGGPVETRSFCVLFRSKKDVKQALHLFDDVYVSFDADFIEGHLKKPGETTDLRLFLGRSQWAPAQLQHERNLGALYSLPAETGLVFTSSPEYLWHNLLERAAPGPVAKGSGSSAVPGSTPVKWSPSPLLPSFP
jgi:putative transcriptional regulator